MSNINIDEVLKNLESPIEDLAKNMFGTYKNKAIQDANDFFNSQKEDLKECADDLANGKIDKDEFDSLVRGKKDMAEMLALKDLGLAQVNIDKFVNGIIDLFEKVVINLIPK